MTKFLLAVVLILTIIIVAFLSYNLGKPERMCQFTEYERRMPWDENVTNAGGRLVPFTVTKEC